MPRFLSEPRSRRRRLPFVLVVALEACAVFVVLAAVLILAGWLAS